MADQRGHEWTPKKQERFLALLGEGYTVAAAAKTVCVSRSNVYKRREADETFAADWDAALEEGTEYLEQEARRRAVKGVKREKLHFYQGEVIKDPDTGKPYKEVVTDYSDTLLIFLLKARKPEVYRDHATVKHEGKVGVAHSVDLSRVSDDDLAIIERILGATAEPGGDPG